MSSEFSANDFRHYLVYFLIYTDGLYWLYSPHWLWLTISKVEAGWSDLQMEPMKILPETELTLQELQAPTEPAVIQERQSTSSFWFANINRQGAIPYGNSNSSYKIFRNVKDYGAVGTIMTLQ